MTPVNKNLFRGRRPHSYRDLQFLGINIVVCLESGIYETFHDDQLEREDPADYGIKLHRIKCSTLLPPHEDQVAEFLEICRGAERAICPKKIYVHCKSGVDRTGYMVAVYRMWFESWRYEEVYAEWVKLGRHWWYDWWKWGMKSWASV